MTEQQRPLKGAWGIVFLLVLFMLINFADKVVVNIAGPPMREELGISAEQFGLVGSSFFFRAMSCSMSAFWGSAGWGWGSCCDGALRRGRLRRRRTLP